MSLCGEVLYLPVLAFLFGVIPALLAGPLFLLLVVIGDTFRGRNQRR